MRRYAGSVVNTTLTDLPAKQGLTPQFHVLNVFFNQTLVPWQACEGG